MKKSSHNIKSLSKTIKIQNKYSRTTSFTDTYRNKVSELANKASQTIQNKNAFRNFHIKKRSSSLHHKKQAQIDEHSMILNCTKTNRKSNITQSRILINKKQNKIDQRLMRMHKKPKNFFEQQKSYKELYKNYLTAIQTDENALELYHQNQNQQQLCYSQIAKTSNRNTIQNNDTIQEFNKLSQSQILQPHDQQLTQQYQYLASKTIYDDVQTPGEVIYKHFSIKYRDYTNMKRKQLQNATSKYNKFHKAQKRILGDMCEQGISEQNQFRMISRIYKTFLLMNGRIKDFNTIDTGPSIKTFKQQVKQTEC